MKSVKSMARLAVVGLAGMGSVAAGDVVYTPVADMPVDGATIDVDGDGLVDVTLSLGTDTSLGNVLRATPTVDWGSEDWLQWRTTSMWFYGEERPQGRSFFQAFGAEMVEPPAGGGGGGGWGGGGASWLPFWSPQPVMYDGWMDAETVYIPVRTEHGEVRRHGWIELRYGTPHQVASLRITGYAIETSGLPLQMGDRGCTFGPPVIVDVTAGADVVCSEGQSAVISFELSGLVGGSTVWRRNGLVVQEGGPSEVWREGEAVLHLDRVRPADAGRYTLEATNACGTTLSLPVTLLVTPPVAAGVALRTVDAPQFGKRYALLEPGVAQWVRNNARAMGGELATIRSPSENEFVRSQVLTFDGQLRDAWIGLNPTGPASAAWWSGHPLVYTNWKVGEPNGWASGEDAVQMYGADGLWNDLASYNGLCGIAELPLNAGAACAADIGGPGGSAARDFVVDNNDLIVFINAFFAEDPLADTGTQGAFPAADGRFDNNDFIVFIDRFFAGC